LLLKRKRAIRRERNNSRKIGIVGEVDGVDVEEVGEDAAEAVEEEGVEGRFTPRTSRSR
jgi:hypothetical protein